jgi:hypothetical protein
MGRKKGAPETFNFGVPWGFPRAFLGLVESHSTGFFAFFRVFSIKNDRLYLEALKESPHQNLNVSGAPPNQGRLRLNGILREDPKKARKKGQKQGFLGFFGFLG